MKKPRKLELAGLILLAQTLDLTGIQAVGNNRS